MNDLVSKLRIEARRDPEIQHSGHSILSDAADEIERLRKTLATVAIFIEGEPIANAVVVPEGQPVHGRHPSLLDTINTALGHQQLQDGK